MQCLRMLHHSGALLFDKVCFYIYFFLFLVCLLLPWVSWCGIEFHVVVALCSTVHLSLSVLVFGNVRRPLVACLVRYAWVSELCASSLNRQLGAFNMAIPLINTSRDEVSLSSTLSQEILTLIISMLALCVHFEGQPWCPVWGNCNFPKSLFVAPDHTTGQ